MFLALTKLMTHSSLFEVRKAVINSIPGPYSGLVQCAMVKRLRDKHPDIRRLVFDKFCKHKVTLENFESKELKMLIIKEGLTDDNEIVRNACSRFLQVTINSEEHKEDLSQIFKMIDCN